MLCTAQASVITFNEQERQGTGYQVFYGYTHGGFQLTGIFACPDTGFQYYNTSPSLYITGNDASATLSSVSGELFSLTSIDLASINVPAPVSFRAYDKFGQEVGRNEILLEAYEWRTHVFTSEFINVASVSWTQSYGHHLFDNVTINETPLPAVPEPSTMALLALGLVGFTGVARQKKRR